MVIDLAGSWVAATSKFGSFPVQIPGSLLSGLLENKLIEDPYYRVNEEKTRPILFSDCSFTRSFSVPLKQLSQPAFLVLEGLDTVADIFINKVKVGSALDMNIAQKIALPKSLLKEENEIEIAFESPYRYINEYDDQGLFFTLGLTEKKSPCLRKANYMFGWDWGANLADMGIFRGISLLFTGLGYLENFRQKNLAITQKEAKVAFSTSFHQLSAGTITATLSYEGETMGSAIQDDLASTNEFVFSIAKPHLWYPNGYGDPSLYELTFQVEGAGEKITYSSKIGLRDVKINDRLDEHGRNLAVSINGTPVFIKGANYIPEDLILNRVNQARSHHLLSLAKENNHNLIRVWGGGYYPDDSFYESCDELGLLVFQDLMFACASYRIDDPSFKKLVKEETEQNLARIRNHPSIIMIAGDNENEDGIRGHGFKAAEQYLELNEKVLEPIVKKETDFYFLPSSPTSGKPRFSMPQDMAYLDTHFWPDASKSSLESYREILPRFLSEFGIQAYPSLATIKTFCHKDEQYPGSKTLSLHEKKPGFEKVILDQVLELYKKPKDFQTLIYLSQLYQAEVIKACVLHLRQNMDVCHGAIYWQLNDDYPSISWSAVDYRFGLKALIYYAKRFYSPQVISFSLDHDEISVHVSSDSPISKPGIVHLAIRDLSGKAQTKKEIVTSLPASSSFVVYKLPAKLLADPSSYLVAELSDEEGHLLSRDIYQMAKDRDIAYPKAHLAIKLINPRQIEVSSDVFAKGVYLFSPNKNLGLSDNFFTLLPQEKIMITSEEKIDIPSLQVLYLGDLQ